MTILRIRQIFFVMRLELQRYIHGHRYIPIYLLSLAPAILLTATQRVNERLVQRAYPIAYAQMFGSFELRLLIFFSCALMFSQLFRSEILEKTLHYYFTVPIRREVVAFGKYIAALSVSLFVFGGSTVVSYFLFFWPSRAGRKFALSPIGITHMWRYVGIVVLACIAYGALFTLIGLLFRNPMIPAVFVALWEYFNYVLPSFFQRISITLYLQSFFPVTAFRGPIEVIVEPPSMITCTVVLLLLSAVLVTASCVVLRHTQIRYSTD
jgi:ABC-type transport system involved in multi-copper enzyme maturation permease subunit